MSVDATDGILGIEARHEWINIETATSLVTLGLEEDGSGGPVWPHYRITDIAGLFDLPEIEDNSEPRTETVGLTAYPSRARGKNVTYTVEVRGMSLKEMRDGGATLRDAFGPDIATGLAVERLMIVTPSPDYGSQQHAFKARCLQVSQGTDAQDRGPNATPTPYVRSVVIGLRLYDPRIYEWNPESVFGLENPKW